MIRIEIKQWKKKMPGIFEKVRRDVEKVTGHHRAGLSLGLAELGMYNGMFVGGMHFSPGTLIVMNKTPLEVVLQEQPEQIVHAYTYHILLHEYIHSLGVINEQQCRDITQRISKQVYKDDNHPARRIARKGIGTFFPDLDFIYAPPQRKPEGISIEYVSGFDRNSYSYYS